MGVIASVVLFALGIIGAAISRQLADEFKEWVPWIISRLIRRAVAKMPQEFQERYEEEWRSGVNHIPGQVGKLLFALDLLSIPGQLLSTRFGFLASTSRLFRNPSFCFCFATTFLFVFGTWTDSAGHALWVLSIIITAAGLFLSLRQSRKLKFPIFYLAYATVSSLLKYLFFSNSRLYFEMAWTFEMLFCLLNCIILLEIIAPPLLQSAQRWILLGFAISAAVSTFFLSIDKLATFIVSFLIPGRSISVGCMLLVLVGLKVFRRAKWTKEEVLITAGVLLLIVPFIIYWISPLPSNRVTSVLFSFNYAIQVMLFSIAGSPSRLRPATN